MVVNELESFFNHRLPAARAAKAAGWEVHVAMEMAETAAKRDTDGLTFHYLPLARSFASPSAEMNALFELRRLIGHVKPHVVHAFTLKPVTLAGIASRLDQGPPFAASVTGVGSFFLAEGLRAAIIKRALMPALRFALGHDRRIAIVQNPDDEAMVTGALRVPADDCVLIPGSGVDLTTFRMQPAEPPGPVKIVLAARLLADKGIREFVEAARILKARGMEAEFALAGGPDPANRSAISDDEVRGWMAEGLVTALGHVTDMPGLNATAHIACLPSYREGLPKSLIEAAACGLPIVATDVPGCREIVREGETGFLVPACDGAALADALGKLIADADLRRRFGEAGRALAESGFSVEAVTTRMLEVYDRLLERA